MTTDLTIRPDETAVYALGGLGEIGKNTYGIEYGDEIIVVDAGVKFPEDDLLGIDYVIPDYTYLKENKDKIKALVITHGHEDHIGAIHFFLNAVNVPVYAGPLAIALIKNKLDEHGLLNSTELHEINEDTVLKFDKMSVEFFRTTHSIPDTFGVAVHTPSGTIVETGDFKFDLTPTTKQPPNLQKMARIGSEGVLLLMSDSTNAERPEFSKSERWVGKTIDKLFNEIDGRIIFATFASNMSRIQMATKAAIEHGRKIAIFGRSMESAVTNGLALGYLDIPEDMLVDAHEINRLPPEEVLIMSTGSQGEPMAALARIANGTHRQISIQPNDTVIFSSSPIPGNTQSVNRVINELEEAGANVIHGKINNIHASGHGGQEEQKLMLSLMKPKFFMPIHGEYRMLKVHEGLGHDIGIPEENTFVLDNGDFLAVSPDEARVAGHIPAQDTYVDGNGIGDVGTAVLRDRQMLSEDGLVVVVATIDLKNKEITAGPDILSRGFIYMRESEDLINEGRKVIFHAILSAMHEPTANEHIIRNAVVSQLQRFLFEQTKRRPLILPMFIMI
ncbi:ribonuclease J1 [Weissella paramesenteroides]|uniref:ribonuclease J1 n=1 Tax=Weissella paramesenteroides TaxID=1249 RepID=UPI00123A6684|nr:ribonuclease J [Weissella paramesenteroides]KAA8454742.1 ribonuclease J [Weissella paramesenteroides]KAA8456755.1 ribonuclease J [Weissella paramesenteroides]KAA8460085.1 ribonuclease J [Weissella paramesenteroides]KAA8461707.1 ribonuclease J [Weissella paramesenteroides]KAA8461952.1 ribonuclease J [Weissella paramesenteroides]